ncbi:sigma-54 dependent transcriptional regulator [Comamonas aquatica]|uniref:sigma-54-dependent transcriptional regulator n=1 Tax=Comamonas aquatica TaxID=225991 RepID=UPI0028D28E6E|nr:sigma-54 dependent transcriptional regulator [Comamonas aquatica]
MVTSFATILVVDDEPDLRMLYELTLLREGYRVETAGTLAEARAQLQLCRFDVLITDMRLPDGSGMELLRELRDQRRRERTIVMTAYGSAENAVEALRCGAFDYLTKPVDLKQFRTVVASAVQGEGCVPKPGSPASGLAAVAHSKTVDILSASTALERLVGESQAMRQVKQRIQKVAQSMAPVLITGESGTGKELVARALHACSHRAQAPWVAVNCGAIPEHLLEAEFFGARKGAYTGATADRPGFFAVACGGTLFLDEIGELPLSMQAKLLRAIQERSVRALGTTQEEPVDVRIVSATHRDLAAAVQTGEFRQDLYYRLNVIDIPLPPLRERREDLPALCRALLQRIAGEDAQPAMLSPQLMEQLQGLPLLGNVRELENLLHRALALGEELAMDGVPTDSPCAEERSVPSLLVAPDELPHDLQAWLDQQERHILTRALHACGYNRTAAAARLGISLRQMRYRIERLNIPVCPEEPLAVSDNPLHDALH